MIPDCVFLQRQRMSDKNVKKRKQPTLEEFQQFRTCDVESAQRFIKKYGIYTKNPLTRSSALHDASMNRDSNVMKVLLDAGGQIGIDALNWTPIDIAARVQNKAAVDVILEHLKQQAHTCDSKSRLYSRTVGKYGNSIEQFENAARYWPDELVLGAIDESNIAVLEFLFERGYLSDQIVEDLLDEDNGYDEQSHPALIWLLKHFDISAPFLVNVIREIFKLNEPILGYLIAVVEKIAEKPRNMTLLDEILAEDDNPHREFVFVMHLAGVDLTKSADLYAPGCEIIIASSTGFTSAALAHPYIALIYPEYVKTSYKVVRKRVLQVCIGLQTLDLPVLLLCTIMEEYNYMWPNVPFHCYWNICEAVKTCYRRAAAKLKDECDDI